MEYGLRHSRPKIFAHADGVLILVVMEYGLRLIVSTEQQTGTKLS